MGSSTGLALLGAVQGIEPGIELLAALFEDEAGIVGNVIATAHEGVDGAESLALALGKNKKCVVEIFWRWRG